MFPKRWHHGHSLVAGGLVGVSIYTYDPWILFAAGVLAGVAGAVATMGGIRLGRTLLSGFEAWRDSNRAKTERMTTKVVPPWNTKTGHWEDEAGDGIPF